MKDKKNNTGIENSGDWNSGYRNSGDWNSGNKNSGDRNSGDRNSGNWNSGDWNSGYWNSGDWNSGYWNSGYKNSGHRNSGDWNSGNRNSGIFNTDEPKMRAFNKETNIKMSDWLDGDDYINFDISLNVWISANEMTDEEKKNVDGWETTEGYLKTLEYKEAWAEWWEENQSEEIIEKIKRLPNFDYEIWVEITGIKFESEPENMIEIDGKKVSESTIKEALKNYLN